MYELNLPSYDVRLRGTQEKPEIFDFLRRRYVTLTPEEWEGISDEQTEE